MKNNSLQNYLQNNPKFKHVGAFAFIALFFVGIVVGMLALNRSQDLRQQASVDMSSPVMYLEGPSTPLQLNQLSRIPVKIVLPAGKDIAGIQASMKITGSVPASVQFVPNSSALFDSFSDPIVQVLQEDNAKIIRFAYLVKISNSFVTTADPLELGVIEITPESSGQITVSFESALTKVEEKITSTSEIGNLLSSFPTQTFQILGDTTASPTATPITEQPIIDPNQSGLQCNQICQEDTNCLTGYCYQPPMPSCAPGFSCVQVMPPKVCRNRTNPMSLTCEGPANTPTPTPGLGGNVCTSISFQTPTNQSQVKVGQSLSFTCGQIGNLEYYEFRVIRPDQSQVALPSISEKSRTSAPFTVQQKGGHVVQCRGCQNRTSTNKLTGCLNWENIPAQ